MSTASALDSIVKEVTKVTDLIEEIAAASTEQAEGISQISIGLEQIDNVTQLATANSEETASAAEELSSQSRVLQELIAQFKLSSKNNKAVLVEQHIESDVMGRQLVESTQDNWRG